MISKQDIERLIYDTVDIVPEGQEDSVFLGFFSLTDNPDTLERILERVTAYYDMLLQTLPLSFTDRLQLQMQRCFTYIEYRCLFTVSNEKQFVHHAVFRTLLITTNAERLLFIRNKKRDESFTSFVSFLQEWSKINNTHINALVHETHNKRTNF